jgi:hypothetical protein
MLGLQKGEGLRMKCASLELAQEVCIKRAGTPMTASRLISAK